MFLAHSIVYISAVVIGLEIAPNDPDLKDEDTCNAVVFNAMMYQALMGFLLLRTFITSFMNLKFSRGRSTANKEFLRAVIRDDNVVTDSILEAEAHE